MRSIKFRGKSINTGEWVYGYFKKNRHGDCYIENDGLATVVDLETVGQLVCIINEDEEVYEGDYLAFSGYGDPDLFLVKWFDSDSNFGLDSIVNHSYENFDVVNETTVVGNIHDQDELPDFIYVVSGDEGTCILGDMNIYKTPKEFVEAIYESGDADEYIEDLKERIEPCEVDTYYYLCNWALPTYVQGAVKCWGVMV